MHIPQIYKQTKADMIAYMKKCAAQYVPQWRYEEENPDAASALAALFANMMEDNISRLNKSAFKDMFTFFDGVGAKMLPATPAEGYVVFELPQGLESEAEVLAGTQLLADTPAEPLIFETREEVLVRQMNIQKVFQVNPGQDAIYCTYERGKQQVPAFSLFLDGETNLQRHKLYVCFPRGLDIFTGAEAVFSFQAAAGIRKDDFRQALQDPSKIRFSYGCKDGYQAIESLSLSESEDEDTEEGAFLLSFEIPGGEQTVVRKEEFGSTYVICADIFDAALFSRLYLSEISLVAKAAGKMPDIIHVNGMDQEPEDFPVFGGTPSIYDECYIMSEEVLGKAGARILLEFDLDFAKIPLETAAEPEKIKWKRIMRKRDFIPDEEYDITIREVIWEYYNGYGWKRLKESSAYKDIFSVTADMPGQRKQMSFDCPLDVQRVLVNAAEHYCIRARIIRMNNAYKTRGAYIVPVAGRVSLSYDYSAAPLVPSEVVRHNNMEISHIPYEAQPGSAFPLCDTLPDEKSACYLGFAQPPVDGPLKLLFLMQDTMQDDMPQITWEYLGESGWKRLHPVDGTKNFHHTGIVSWFGNRDIRQEMLFADQLYWIRLTDAKEQYAAMTGREHPAVKGIYPNAAGILGIETLEDTYGIDPYAQQKQIQLPDTDIADINVQVAERMGFGRSMVQLVWETWKETDELSEESARQKEFVIDRINGRLTFPKYMKTEYLDEQGEIVVRIRYGRCQGERGNLPAGAVSRLNRTVGFISASYNPAATACGTPRETVMEAVRRNARILRHGYRCVSAQDYEDMAWEATRNISRVKCFTGYDKDKKKKPGAVTLVALPKEHEDGADSFEKTKIQIYDFLAAHMDENIIRLGNFHIVRPQMIRMDVKAVVTLAQKEEIFAARKRALTELERFLNPLWGNYYGEGWEIGTLPDKNQILHALKRVEGVRQVSQLELHRYQQSRSGESELSDGEPFPFYLLPESGVHEILIEL